MVVNRDGSVTLVSEVQFANAPSPIEVTVSGISIDTIEEHPWNAPRPMLWDTKSEDAGSEDENAG
jgi:hypothetical protein